MRLALLADIGGTNTRVALARGLTVDGASIRRYSNASYKAAGQDIGDILRDYIAEIGADLGASIGGCCVAAAGPVQAGVAHMTNLDWMIDAPKLKAATGAQDLAILNDLQAQGEALGHIALENLHPVITRPETDLPTITAAMPRATMLVVGLGTGVNAAPVHLGASQRLVPPSECGHVNLVIRNAEDLRLLQFIEGLLASRNEVAHCGVEEVLSGRGLANLYSFAAHEAGQAASPSSAEVLAALEKNDPIAVHAAALYTRILGQMLADQALIHLPYGGIYLIGGMARAMVPHFDRFGLTTAFREPRRVDLLQKDFTVTVVEDDYAALTGCAAYLMSHRQSGA